MPPHTVENGRPVLLYKSMATRCIIEVAGYSPKRNRTHTCAGRGGCEADAGRYSFLRDRTKDEDVYKLLSSGRLDSFFCGRRRSDKIRTSLLTIGEICNTADFKAFYSKKGQILEFIVKCVGGWRVIEGIRRTFWTRTSLTL